MIVDSPGGRVQTDRADSDGPVGWLTSFGDLLTLLLCFFISILAVSPLNPNMPVAISETDGTVSKASLIGQVGTATARRAGIAIANDSSKVAANFGWLLQAIELRASDFLPSGLGLQPGAISRLENALLASDYRLALALIGVCESQVWQAGLGQDQVLALRAAPIYRQMIDAGVAAKLTSFELVDDCEGDSSGADNQQLLARVRLAFEMVD